MWKIKVTAIRAVFQGQNFKRDKENLPIKLIAANPHPNFIDRWPEWKNRYTTIMEDADLTRDICDGYKRGVYQIRNEWMVDHSA